MKVSELFEMFPNRGSGHSDKESGHKPMKKWHVKFRSDKGIATKTLQGTSVADIKKQVADLGGKFISADSMGKLHEHEEAGYNDRMKLKEVKQSAADASAHYEKLKGWLEQGINNVTQRMVDGAKRTADDLWDKELAKREKNMVDKHGAEWWELVKKQYPIEKNDDGDWVVTSKIRDWADGKDWPFQYKAQAVEKVDQLVRWLHSGRKRGFGDKDADIEKWLGKLNAVDKAKITEGFGGDFLKQTSGGKGVKGPQWTSAELADKFGMTSAQLTAARKKFPGFPEPSLTHNANHTANKRVYYDLKAATKWYQDALKQVSGDIEELKKQLKS